MLSNWDSGPCKKTNRILLSQAESKPVVLQAIHSETQVSETQVTGKM